jgi:hypothetical protein
MSTSLSAVRLRNSLMNKRLLCKAHDESLAGRHTNHPAFF